MKQRDEIAVIATLENMGSVLAFVEQILRKIQCPEKQSKQIITSVEEIYVNIVNYAYEKKTEQGVCRLAYELQPGGSRRGIRIITKDTGVPFNPLEKEMPNLQEPADERNVGGLGIYMVTQYMDAVTYQYENDTNILIMEKYWNIK